MRNAPPDHRSPSGRYQTDPMFAGIVDLLESYIHAAKLTPHELREAAGLAAFHAVMRAPMGPHIHFLQALTSNAPPVGPPPVVLVDGLPYRLDVHAEHPDSQRAVCAMQVLEERRTESEWARGLRRGPDGTFRHPPSSDEITGTSVTRAPESAIKISRNIGPVPFVRVPVSNDEPESDT